MLSFLKSGCYINGFPISSPFLIYFKEQSLSLLLNWSLQVTRDIQEEWLETTSDIIKHYFDANLHEVINVWFRCHRMSHYPAAFYVTFFSIVKYRSFGIQV